MLGAFAAFAALACSPDETIFAPSPPVFTLDGGHGHDGGRSVEPHVDASRGHATDAGPPPPSWDAGYCGQFTPRTGGSPSLVTGGSWARSFRGWSDIRDLALDTEDSVVVGGITLQRFEIAGHVIDPPVGVHGYLAKLSRDGAYLWSQLLTTSSIDFAPSVTALPGGATAAALRFEQQLGLGRRMYDAPVGVGGPVAVMKLDSAGLPSWVRILPGGLRDPAPDVAADQAGNVYVVGNLGPNEDMVASDAGAPTGESILALSPSGGLLWHKRLEGSGYSSLRAVAVDSLGRIVLGGLFSSTVTIDGTILQSRGFENETAFLAKLTETGTLMWARSIEGRYDTSALVLAVGPNDDIALAGGFSGELGVAGDLHVSRGFSTDVFAMKFDSEGRTLWRTSFGALDLDAGYAVTFDADGNVTVGGVIWGTVELGATTLTSGVIRNAFVATIDGSGAYRAAAAYPASGVSYVSGLAYGTRGQLVVGGTFDCVMDLPLGGLAGGDTTGFVMVQGSAAAK